jgi:thymidine kinase
MSDFSNKMCDFTEGYLEIILGPMFSGKTTELIRIYKTYDFIGQTPLVINYSGDTRYSTTHLSSHDEIKLPCIFIDKLMYIIEDDCIQKVDVVLINEGQFFEDLYEFVVNLVEKYNKKVYICGLDGDFKQKRFGTILDLIPHCDKVVKMRALCALCRNGKPAAFSHRVSSEEDQIVIGVNNYIPLCRLCYNSKNKNK